MIVNITPLLFSWYAGFPTLDKVRELAVDMSTTALKKMGEDNIRAKAKDVAREVEMYIWSHPDVTMQALQADERFQTIALQQVGRTEKCKIEILSIA